MTRARAVPDVQLGLFGVSPEVETAGVADAEGEFEERVRAFGEHTELLGHIRAPLVAVNPRHIAEAQIGPSRAWPPEPEPEPEPSTETKPEAHYWEEESAAYPGGRWVPWAPEPEALATPEPAEPPAPDPDDEAPTDATIIPLLKYPGGKAKLAPAILSVLFPDGWDRTRLVEPFAGPASVSHTAIARGFRGTVELYDASPIIPTLHHEVAFNWPEVTREIHALPQSGVTKEVYVSVREAFNRTAPGPLAAAQYLWLNRMCFNGLHRFSRAGFNADYGKKLDVPLGVILEAGRAARDRYAQVKLTTACVDCATAFLSADTRPAVIYCDPPYLGGYDNYTSAGFKVADHERLAIFAQRAAQQGHRVAISGVDTPRAREVYAGAEVRIIGSAARSINRDGAGRAAKVEVLFLYGSF